MNPVWNPTKCKSITICCGNSKVVKFRQSNQIIGAIDSSLKNLLELKLHFQQKKASYAQIFMMVRKSHLIIYIIISLEMKTNLKFTHNMYYLLSDSTLLFMNDQIEI